MSPLGALGLRAGVPYRLGRYSFASDGGSNAQRPLEGAHHATCAQSRIIHSLWVSLD
ncbi:hypothetical protein GCM10010383_77360 [Streptomyces lomondensis]|uniref:Uncharacterized protein n=1 Tax=Streptomyces lomondensis TaxID=68229 RepID=A0ABQ2XVG8_9ACTN|nr:hypothetical protein GCM10010383_77360 [Streptomyces lomondensis]